MIKMGWMASLFIIVGLLLGACSASFEEVQKEARETVELEFNNKREKANNSNKDIEYHLPFGIEKEDETANNIILKNGSRTYILFYNQHENAGSKVLYESTLKQNAEWDVNQIYEEGGKFGYMLVKKTENDVYQVVTGIGGIKVTTETKNLKSDATTMMKIANSVKVK